MVSMDASVSDCVSRSECKYMSAQGWLQAVIARSSTWSWNDQTRFGFWIWIETVMPSSIVVYPSENENVGWNASNWFIDNFVSFALICFFFFHGDFLSLTAWLRISRGRNRHHNYQGNASDSTSMSADSPASKQSMTQYSLVSSMHLHFKPPNLIIK